MPEPLPPPPEQVAPVLGIVVAVALAITVIVSGVYSIIATGSHSGTTTEAAPVETVFAETGTDCEESAIATMPVDEAEGCLRQIASVHGYAVDPQLGAFTTSYNACSASSVEELATEYGTDPFAAIVAGAYAADAYPKAQHAGLDGCFLALT